MPGATDNERRKQGQEESGTTSQPAAFQEERFEFMALDWNQGLAPGALPAKTLADNNSGREQSILTI
jgi:hypothetical protein